jgi:hypothetical protein
MILLRVDTRANFYILPLCNIFSVLNHILASSCLVLSMSQRVEPGQMTSLGMHLEFLSSCAAHHRGIGADGTCLSVETSSTRGYTLTAQSIFDEDW